jgi:autotransporter-associated beta strand protein
MPEKHGELDVVRADELSDATGQSAGALRLSGVDGTLTGATSIWMGKVSNEPGYQSVAHHHGEAQTAGYCLKGRARIYYGEGYAEYVDLDEGDFVFVPPFFPHIEANRSHADELVWLTARTPGNIVVNLEG